MNIIYFFYFIKISDWKRLRKHREFVSEKYGLSKWHLFWDVVGCALKYGISFHEYYYYGFYQKPAELRAEYASMGFMYRYQKTMNPPDKRSMLADKNKFDKAFAEFMHRDLLNPINATIDEISAFVEGREKVVLKRSTGGGGKNVEILKLKEDKITPQIMKDEAIAKNYDILEEFVQQHEDLQKLSPNSLNTVRFITQRTKDGHVEVVGASLRMGIYKNTDNLSSGGITCKVNIETGQLESKGYAFDITQPLCDVHPVSGIALVGFQIPCWDAVKTLCINAASKYDDNKSVGWDVAIKQDGPLLIEGNHDWGARVWQMPAGHGLKPILEKYLSEYKS